jgi:hypothetical protein
VLFDRTALKKQYSSSAYVFYNLQNSKLFNKKEPILNVLHLESDKEKKKLIIPMMILAILVAFFAGKC